MKMGVSALSFFKTCNGLRDSDLSYNKEDAVATIWLGYRGSWK